jgi:hypothetical protein
MKKSLFAAFVTLTLAAAFLAGPAAARPRSQGRPQPRRGSPQRPAHACAPQHARETESTGVINIAFSGDSVPFSFVDAKSSRQAIRIDLCKRVI